MGQMHRFFIAIFSLHFFFSVCAFSFGYVGGTAFDQAHASSVQQVDAPEGVGGDEASANHALNDDLPDLPDSLPRAVFTPQPPVFRADSIVYRQIAVLHVSLDGLLRPPRQAALTA